MRSIAATLVVVVLVGLASHQPQEHPYDWVAIAPYSADPDPEWELLSSVERRHRRTGRLQVLALTSGMSPGFGWLNVSDGWKEAIHASRDRDAR